MFRGYGNQHSYSKPVTAGSLVRRVSWKVLVHWVDGSRSRTFQPTIPKDPLSAWIAHDTEVPGSVVTSNQLVAEISGSELRWGLQDPAPP